MTRRLLALLVGVALPTLLLGAGWLAASMRERDVLEQKERERLERSADVVRAAVDESLEELRHREDARPFYLYNHFYSPPDVLAVSDPIALSPLGRDPEDARIVGYFQVDPDGTVHTPFTAEPGEEPPPRGARVLSLLRMAPFADLRGLSHGNPQSSLLPTARPGIETPARVAPQVVRGGRREGSGHRREPVEEAVVASAEAAQRNPTNAGNIGNPELGPEGPLTVALNAWGQSVYEDVSAAQSGDLEANRRVQERGRQAPVTRRNYVEWPEAETPARSTSTRSASTRSTSTRSTSTNAQHNPRNTAQQYVAPQAAPEDPRPPVVAQQEIEVDYTPMAWIEAPGALVLHRVVSHEGTAVVQGVVIDRAHIVSQWLPELVARHATSDVSPRIVEAGGDEVCSVRARASDVMGGLQICYPPEALASITAATRGNASLELGALFGLVLVVVVAGVVIERAARRSEELSRQKSDFVSAVSHELRTPLTTIRMHAEMLRDGMVSEGKRGRFHEDLVAESVRLSRLVENVLELSRIERGQRPFRPTRGDVVAFAREIVESQRSVLEAKGFTLTAPDREQEPLETEFDRQAVDQILVNLIENAAKYGRGAEAVIDVRVERDGPMVALLVDDRGPGVPEAERERVFRRFHRVERKETAHMPGTGIGLALVRDLAHAHGGEATLGPRGDGPGARARVTLPMTGGAG